MLSKTLNSNDYLGLLKYTDIILNYRKILRGVDRYEHQHRLWEYATVLAALEKSRWAIGSVLDVGGGGSLMLPLLTSMGYNTVGVDPGYDSAAMQKLAEVTNTSLKWQAADFFAIPYDKYDAVICTSVLEHVEDHLVFFEKLLDMASYLVCLTVDFHPSGKALLYPNHLRTYSEDAMLELIYLAQAKGFYSGGYDYSYFDPNVNGCTFASLVLEKK